jgi:hypothetical protein
MLAPPRERPPSGRSRSALPRGPGDVSFNGMRLEDPLLGTGAETLVFYELSLDAIVRITKDAGGLRLWY